MPSTFRSIRAYEMRPDGVRARVEESADSMKHHSLTEVEEGKRGRAHRRSRIPRFSVLSNAPQRARAFTRAVASDHAPARLAVSRFREADAAADAAEGDPRARSRAHPQVRER